MKNSRKMLSVVLAAVMFALTFVTALVPASAANDLNNAVAGGVSVIFMDNTSSMQTNISSIDPSDSKTYYVRYINRSNREATIVAANSSDKISSSAVGLTLPPDGYITRTINKASLGTTDNALFNFSISYTLADTYDQDGNTLYRFYQPTFIGIWNTSDDSKQPPKESGGENGFVINGGRSGLHNGLDVQTCFQTEKGIIEQVSLTGNRTLNVNFEYNYWLDVTDFSSKTWETAGFRLFVKKWVDQRNCMAPTEDGDNAGSFNLEGTFDNSSQVSLTQGDISTSWNYPASFSYPGGNYVANQSTGFVAHRTWSKQGSTKYATLWDAGDSGYIPFGGVLFESNGSSANPAVIKFNRIMWLNDRTGSTKGYYSGTVNTYVFDKSALKNLVSNYGGISDFAPVSGRFTASAWNNYNNALQNAMQVLANYKTTQYAVNSAYDRLSSAISALQNENNLARQVVSVTDRIYNSDKSSQISSSSTRYILAPLGSYTVPLSNSAKNTSGVNKCTAPVTVNYTVKDNRINSIGSYDYWKIDFSAVESAVAAADAILNKNWCYTEDYLNRVNSAKQAVEAIDTTSYSSTPENQTAVNSAVAALNSLTNAELVESNHKHISGDWIVDQDETCTVDGIRHKECIYCGVITENGTIPAKGHDFSEWKTEKAANCVETGLQTRTCKNGCGTTEQNILVVDPNNHKGPSDLRNASEGNCGADGYTGDLYCQACSRLVTKGQVIPATNNHSWVEIDSAEGTCKIDGFVKYKCSVCNKTKTENTGKNPENHKGTTTVIGKIAATCTEDGYTGDIYCDDCNEIITKGSTVKAAGHTPGEWTVIKYADCGENGTRIKTCTVCGETVETDVIPATGNHNYETVIEAKTPTCKEEGHTAKIACSVCGNVQQESTPIDKLPHTVPADWDEIKEPVCGTPGYKLKHCTVCGEVAEREEIPASTTHTFTLVDGSRVPSTCKTHGSEKYVCSGCGFVEERTLPLDPNNHESDEIIVKDRKEADCGNDGYTGDKYHKCCDVCFELGSVIPKTNKHYYEETDRVDATCVKDGEAYLECTVCHNTKIEVLPKNPENHTDNTELRGYIEATCTTNGYSGDLYCLDCGQLISEGTEVFSTGHAQGRTVVFRNATCTTDGLMDVYCKFCDQLYDSIVIPATGHLTVIDPAVAPTCTESGKTQGAHCSACDIVLIAQQEIPALGHTAGAWVTVTEATCGTEGLREQYCMVCGEILASEIIPTTGEHHYEITESVASTCATPGKNVYECTVCGNKITETLALDPDNHEGPEEIINYKDVTCGADGYTGDKICSACEAVLETGVTVPMTGLHTYDDGVFTVTATKDHNGIKRYTCLNCDDYYEVEIVWTPHTHRGGESGATCTVRAKCSECGQPYGEYNNSKHTALRNVEAVAPDCTHAGHGEGVFCDDCVKYVSDPQIIPALGHTDENGDGYCDVCRVEIPKVITSENFRCSFCDKYEANKDATFGFIYTIVHAIVHFIESIFIF